jgi:hypothetical protein
MAARAKSGRVLLLSSGCAPLTEEINEIGGQPGNWAMNDDDRYEVDYCSTWILAGINMRVEDQVGDERELTLQPPRSQTN